MGGDLRKPTYVALGAVIVALLLLCLPVSADPSGDPETHHCGSGLSRDREGFSDGTRSPCEDARRDRLVFVGLAALVAVGAVVVVVRRSS